MLRQCSGFDKTSLKTKNRDRGTSHRIGDRLILIVLCCPTKHDTINRRLVTTFIPYVIDLLYSSAKEHVKCERFVDLDGMASCRLI